VLADTLEQMRSMLAQRTEEKGLELVIGTTPSDLAALPLLGDPLHLRQILLNLAGNAIKFTDHGSINLRIHLLASTSDSVQLRFEVQDTGIGITLDQQQRLFTAFEQADSSTTRKYGGTGLGLVICKLLVELMHGEIGLDSQPGLGSTFWFTIPLGKSKTAAASPQPHADAAAAEQLRSRFTGTRILLVEDEPINQLVSQELLEHVGLVVDLAEDGEQAIALSKLNQYALILMDLHMPNLNGTDATQAIRALPNYAATPILAMTSSVFEEDRETCLQAGMNDHIGKPVEPEELFEILLQWLPGDTAR
jgi:CheY-like chemotaxis protein